MPEENFPLEITAKAAAELFNAAPESVRIIDVREPHELEICRVPGAEHIPMRQIPERLSILPRDRRLLILCHVGARSLRVTHYLRAQGFTAASNIAGGIEAWSCQVDPGVPRY